jgi:ankyrin repeat protein
MDGEKSANGLESFLDAAKHGDAGRVRNLMLSSGGLMRGAALILAAENGHAHVVELLLAGCDPKSDKSRALVLAAQNGHAGAVALLMLASDAKAKSSMALRQAAMHGHAEVVRLLIPASDPLAMDSDALAWAARRGHAKVVELLLPVSDPAGQESEGLMWAARNGHMEVLELMWAAFKGREAQFLAGVGKAGLNAVEVVSRMEKRALAAVAGAEEAAKRNNRIRI